MEKAKFGSVFRLLCIIGISFFCSTGIAYSANSPISPSIRSAAIAQAKTATKKGELCLSTLLNRNIPSYQVPAFKSKNFQGIKGNISMIVGGRNYTAADVDQAEVPFYTVNGLGLSTLLHDGGEWPGTGGSTDNDDGRVSFSVDWAGEFYDLDQNGHYPKAVLRYIGSHCYIFVPAMFFPTLARGISSTEDATPAAKSEWGMTWPDTTGWGGDVYYYAAATGAKTLEPRFVLGADKNLARLKLKEFADEFDGIIYPKMREYFGTEPDVDSDAKIFILLDDIRDGAGSFRGYFWAANEYPRTQVSYSNEKELLYIDLFPTFLMSSQQGYRTTAHEFTHMIFYNEGTEVVDGVLQEEERWVEEGCTQYASYLYDKSHTSNLDEFIKKPDTILVEPRTDIWLGNDPFANYGASYLFMFYIMEHYGGSNASTFMKNLVRDKAQGITGINNALKGFSVTMESVFADWAIANFVDKERKLDQSSLNDGKWGYAVDNDYDTTNNLGVNQSLPVKYSEHVILSTTGAQRSSSVSPWAADYIEITGNTGNLNLGFDGDDRTQFKAAVIKRGPQVDPSIEYIYLNEKQSGNLIIQNYGAGNTYENLVLVPMITATANYEKMNYVYSATFADLKVALFPNPIYENNLHIITKVNDKFAATPRVQMTYNGEQGYLTMTAVTDNTYITNYVLKSSGEGSIEAFGTNTNGTILSNILKFSAVYYPPKSEGSLTAAFGSLSVPKSAMKSGGYVILSASSNQASFENLLKVTPVLDLCLPVSQTDLPVTVKIPSQAPLVFNTEKAGLFAIVNDKPKWLGKVKICNGTCEGTVQSGGSIFVGVDTTPPVINTECEPAGNDYVAVGLDEKGSGIDPDSIIVSYKSEKLPFRYDVTSSKIIVKTSSLLDGKYEFDVQVSDYLGNSISSKVSAQVIGNFSLAQIINYPNPARAFTSIRGAFTGLSATKLQVQVTIRDSSGDEVFWARLPHKGNGIYEATWNLLNSDGRAVANGVYYAEVEAYCESGEIKEKRKIAVLR